MLAAVYDPWATMATVNKSRNCGDIMEGRRPLTLTARYDHSVSLCGERMTAARGKKDTSTTWSAAVSPVVADW